MINAVWERFLKLTSYSINVVDLGWEFAAQ